MPEPPAHIGAINAVSSRRGTGWGFGDYNFSGGKPDATDYGLLLQGKSAYQSFGAL